MHSERLTQLVDRYLLGQVSPQELAELEETVLRSATARDQFWDRVSWHSVVREFGEQSWEVERAQQSETYLANGFSDDASPADRPVILSISPPESPIAGDSVAPVPDLAETDSSFTEPPPPDLFGSPTRSTWGFLGNHAGLFSLLGVAMVIGSLATWFAISMSHRSGESNDVAVKPAPPAVATVEPPAAAWIALTDGCHWLDEESAPQVGDTLAAGRSLHLAAGVVEIHFDIGARIILQGPASFRIESPTSARLTLGKLTAEITTHEARGFKIFTPEATLVDQGTEFGVEVAPGGSQRVHVFRGEVDVTVNGKGSEPASPMKKLTANEAARLEHNDADVTLYEETGESFLRTMDQVHRDRHVVAYWRFEDHPVGDLLPDAARNTKPIRGTVDSSFNGNDLYCYSASTPPRISGDVPECVVPRTGQANMSCLDNSEPLPNKSLTHNVYTHSSFSHASPIDIQKITPTQWTIEASIKALHVRHGVQTFVGRDAAPVHPNVDLPGLLAFQITPQGRLAVHFWDEEERRHEVVADHYRLLDDHWYHVAAVSNGRNLSLYINAQDGRGFHLIARTDLPTTGSRALTNLSDEAEWTVGRGMVSGKPAEWFQGWIDEVRISDIALNQKQFLFAKTKENVKVKE